ncbi:uncharacterized protein [Coffea arabica]|uniref:RNase H type-1 domain-containing protein n=1 Tax=Coffea arabica TaxID=13443 RepID=A0A6P6XEC7_COFAR|nr:uncharacterized protein LOC113741098 [Coffea arabica]
MGKGEGRCSCFGEGVETIEHLLFFCMNAVEVRKIAPIRWDGLKDKQHNLWLWWEKATQSISKDHVPDRVNLTINIFWQIWKTRNKKVFENECQNPYRIVTKAQEDWMEYEQAREEEQDNNVPPIHSEHQKKRETAKEDEICLFTDAAISAKMKRMGQRIVARNWKGKNGIVNQYKGVPSKEEALAISNAMLMAKHVGWTKIIVYSDSKSVIDQINGSNDYEYNIATILEDVQELRTHFESCRLVFIPRSENEISHTLAEFAVKLVYDIEWEQDLPSWLTVLVRKEMRVVALFCN